MVLHRLMSGIRRISGKLARVDYPDKGVGK